MSAATSHPAYVFDTYGTLFDVHAAVRRYASEVGSMASACWRSGVTNSSNIPGCAR